ncbi:MAG TPA: Uma2 family endonuclease [Saprospiraceae bacterium]|nr:Uma2 family endonuclease [Saprospiraceae bacterium]HMQ85426.1 Uma2 family endonuclease [Saprospiraceae bacterium]
MRNGDTTKLKNMSLEAYIAFEERAEVRHEFNNGQLIPMPGTTDKHNDICLNLAIIFRHLLKASSCKVYMESVKVQISHRKHYTYPDIFVTCDERDQEDAYIKRYPLIIVEVASPSTKVYDKTDKFLDYRKIKSLRHYLVVDTENELVECYSRKNGNSWVSEVYFTNTDLIALEALGINLPMSAIYDQIQTP